MKVQNTSPARPMQMAGVKFGNQDELMRQINAELAEALGRPGPDAVDRFISEGIGRFEDAFKYQRALWDLKDQKLDKGPLASLASVSVEGKPNLARVITLLNMLSNAIPAATEEIKARG